MGIYRAFFITLDKIKVMGKPLKRVIVSINEGSITKVLGAWLELVIEDEANVLDVIMKVDEVINSKSGFLLSEYRGLLHMLYNPITGRFYKQVGVHAYTEPGKFYNVRDNVRQALPNGATIVLIPNAGCIGEWEKVLEYKEFCKAFQIHKSMRAII